MKTAGDFVRAALFVELAARVKLRHDDFDGADATGVHSDRDTAAVIFDGDAVIDVNRDTDVLSVTRESFIDRVVDNLVDEVADAN